MDIVLFLFNGKIGYAFFVLGQWVGPVGDLGVAVCPESNNAIVLHLVVTADPYCGKRLSIRRRSHSPWTPREPLARPCTIMENQRKPYISIGFPIDFQRILMVFDDFW